MLNPNNSQHVKEIESLGFEKEIGDYFIIQDGKFELRYLPIFEDNEWIIIKNTNSKSEIKFRGTILNRHELSVLMFFLGIQHKLKTL